MLQENDAFEAINRLTIQWLAGFFDGEGSISAQISYDLYVTVDVSITQKDPKILSLILLRYNNGNLVDYKGANNATCYKWRIRGKSAEKFLSDIAPFSIVKRRQIEKALELLKFIGDTSKESLLKRKSLGEEIRDLNKEGNVSGIKKEVM